MPTVIASSKGQIVIPKKEREKVGIKPGLRVVVQAVGDHIEIRPLPENPVDYFCGIFKGGPSLTKRLLQDRREEMNREDQIGIYKGSQNKINIQRLDSGHSTGSWP
jgi:AbrB family looped-hinge helix DNA binding protein